MSQEGGGRPRASQEGSGPLRRGWASQEGGGHLRREVDISGRKVGL